MKSPLRATLILALLTLSSACNLRNATNGYAGTDEYCGGVPSERCPL